MAYTVFAANKAKTGGALIVKQSSKDNSVLLTLFKQINFDQNNKKDNFDWQNSIMVKLSEDELGDFLRTLRTNSKTQFYHTFEDKVTTGSLSYFSIQDKDDASKPPRCGFGLSVTKGEQTIKVSLSLGAAERFAEYLRFSLDKAFEAGFIEDIKKEAEYMEKKAAKTNKTEKKVEKPAVEKPSAPTATEDTTDPDF